MRYTVCMVVPVLPHEVKVRWYYFTFSRTQLPVLCVYVEGAICRDNDLVQGSATQCPRAPGRPQGLRWSAAGLFWK